MGKKGSCFSAVKKVLCTKNKKKEKQNQKSRKWFQKQKNADLDSSGAHTTTADPAAAPPIEQMRFAEAENEQNEHSYAGALATAVTARELGESKEEFAAIMIETAFRGYMARRGFRALRGLVRLKKMVEGQSVKRQATSALRYMHTVARVQSEIHTRRIRMLEDKMALFQQKNEKEQEKLIASKFGDIWNDSTQSREQVEANLQSKQEAALRRERALAYAYTHQKTQRHPSKATNQTFTDSKNPQWGWSCLERRMVSRLWEDKSAFDKELNSIQHTAKLPTNHATSVGEFDHSRRDFHLDNVPSPTAHKQSQSPSTPRSTPVRIRLANPRRSSNVDGDSRSIANGQSDRGRRHSISSIREHESLARFPHVPSYMAAKESAKTTKLHLPSSLDFKKNGTPEKGTCNSAKKRLSFSTSPRGPRRHSDPQS
ncbi:protein IQ-DOMAIN 3-like [Nicotiana tabacum]|uniref:Protein IQ-DOMAIN 1-like n=2 Tax=Nicotiana tabacum TaxID=4097 RepID=A0A1S3X9N8_TOBAC|nr:PREDICTED: protein IQ-DOMAIN 1-like [Nicotiana tabacum]